MYLVSAILRTITLVLDSEASLNKSSILYAPVQAGSSLGTLKEVGVINEVKLEISNDVDHVEVENFVVEGEKEIAEERQDNCREPGEISDRKRVKEWPEKENRKSVIDFPEEENDKKITAIPNEKTHILKNEYEDERMLSVTEQNYIRYSLSEYHQPISEQPTSKSKSLICQFCSYSTKRKEKRDRIKELKRHYEDVHFICKLCGDFQVTKPSLMNHLKATHIQGSGYFLCGIDGCGHKEKVFRKNGRMKFKFNALYAHIRKQH